MDRADDIVDIWVDTLTIDNKEYKSGSPQRFPTFFVPCPGSTPCCGMALQNQNSIWTTIFTTAMPVNKNALIRYKTLNRCLRNKYRRWTLDDLVEACSDALYEMEGITRGVSVRTVQADLQVMRSDKLGYNAPIEVYDNKYYRYSDPDYSISDSPIDDEMYELVTETVDKLKACDTSAIPSELTILLSKVKDKLALLL